MAKRKSCVILSKRLHKLKKSKITIQDIAKELNITASTVSRALNDHPAISIETKRKVHQIADKFNYRPNRIAAALRSGKTRTIGVVVPAADRTFFGAAIRGIEDEADQAGYRVIVCQSHEDVQKEKKALEALFFTQVDAIISSAAKGTSDFQHYQDLKNQGTPIIFFDNALEGLGVSSVVANDYLGAHLAVTHLIEQGCRRIAHFAGQQSSRIYRERLRGYKTALEEKGISFDPSLVLDCISDVDAGKECTRKLLDKKVNPDAIFSASDFAALGAMQYLKAKHIRIPQDIAIVGFANEPFTALVEPSLSTVDQHSRQMGQQAARLFLETTLPQTTIRPKRIILEPELIIRTSSLKKAPSIY